MSLYDLLSGPIDMHYTTVLMPVVCLSKAQDAELRCAHSQDVIDLGVYCGVGNNKIKGTMPMILVPIAGAN